MKLSRRSLLAAHDGACRAAAARAQEKVVRYGISMADIPLTTRPARSRRRRLPVHRPHDLRSAGRLGDGCRRPAGQADPRPRHRMEGQRGRQDAVDLQAAARREVPRRLGLRCRCRRSGTSRRSSTRTRRSSTSARPSQVRPRLPSDRELQEDRRHGRSRSRPRRSTALFPYQMLWFLVVEPGQWEKHGKDWNKVASEPSGTGPFKLARLVPRERAELVKNEGYWNPKRMPKTDRLVLICAPEDSSRTAALSVERGRHDRDAAARRGGAPQAGAACASSRT